VVYAEETSAKTRRRISKVAPLYMDCRVKPDNDGMTDRSHDAVAGAGFAVMAEGARDAKKFRRARGRGLSGAPYTILLRKMVPLPRA
jgi:hypothetical protein